MPQDNQSTTLPSSNPAVQSQPQSPAIATQAATNPNSTQNSLLISELRENMVVMRDGSFRAILACKSINFDLMSSREREGIEFSYQNFINALRFPVQITIRSQKIDIAPYLDKLASIRNSLDNMLLGILMDDYINFIDVLSQEANIMDKSFFITIPYFPEGDIGSVVEKGKGFFSRFLPNATTPKAVSKIDDVSYQKAKDEIANRIESTQNGLFQIGVQSAQLRTKELGELYYNVYNPDTAVREQLGDFTEITSTFVRKGDGEAMRPHLKENSL